MFCWPCISIYLFLNINQLDELNYVGQTSRNLKSRFREHIRYIKSNDPRSAYALHILNCRHEYGNINNTMTLLKQINTPTLLLPYEQMYIQSFHHNNELIPEQHPNEHNTMFDLLRSNTTRHNPPDAWPTIPCIPSSPLSTCAWDGHL